MFDALTADLQSEVMRSLARKGIAPSKALSEGSFVLAAPRSLLEHLVGAFPELLFDGNYWDTTFKTLDYGDLQLTDRAREQIVNRARSLVADAAWLADADPTILASLKKEELIRGLMSVSLLRPDREVL